MWKLNIFKHLQSDFPCKCTFKTILSNVTSIGFPYRPLQMYLTIHVSPSNSLANVNSLQAFKTSSTCPLHSRFPYKCLHGSFKTIPWTPPTSPETCIFPTMLARSCTYVQRSSLQAPAPCAWLCNLSSRATHKGNLQTKTASGHFQEPPKHSSTKFLQSMPLKIPRQPLHGISSTWLCNC